MSTTSQNINRNIKFVR